MGNEAMTRVVLHIGMHKTASTYIQKRLQANQPLLRQHGIRFDDDSKNRLKIAARRSDFKPWSRPRQCTRSVQRCSSESVQLHLRPQWCVP